MYARGAGLACFKTSVSTNCRKLVPLAKNNTDFRLFLQWETRVSERMKHGKHTGKNCCEKKKMKRSEWCGLLLILLVEAISSQFWTNPAFCVRKLKFRTHVHKGVYFHYRSGGTLVTLRRSPRGETTPEISSPSKYLGS